MNTYFTSLSSTNGPNSHVPSANNDLQTAFAYENDYNRANFPSSFDRLATRDSFMGNYSNFNMMQAAAAAAASSTSTVQPHAVQPMDHSQPTNDYRSATTHGSSSWKPAEPISSSMNDLMPHQLPNFSMAATNSMLYYAHPWMRPGTTIISKRVIY